MKTIVLALSAAVGLAQSAIAGPDATVKKFMNQHVSLLDWGMFHVQNDIEQDVANKFEKIYTNVYYDFSRNEIVINLLNTQSRVSEDNDEAKRMCKRILNEVRDRGGVDTDTGKLMKWVGSNSLYAAEFSNNGFDYDGIDDERPMLDEKMVIYVRYKGASCSGDLVSTVVNYQE